MKEKGNKMSWSLQIFSEDERGSPVRVGGGGGGV